MAVITCSQRNANPSQSHIKVNSVIELSFFGVSFSSSLGNRRFIRYSMIVSSCIKNIGTMSYLDNIRTFVRVYELGSMSAAGRDLRISPAVTSARISQLEDYLGVRLFQRTTRNLTATEQGQAFYGGAVAVLESVDAAEARVMNLTETPRGSLFVAAPLGVGATVGCARSA